MGFYIKTNGSSIEAVAGTEANKQMLDDGYFFYEGELPNYTVDLLKWNEEEKKIYVDSEKLNESLQEEITKSLSRLETFHKDFIEKIIGELSLVEVSTWDFKFRLAADLDSNSTLSKEQQIYLDAAEIKTKKAKTAWTTKVLNKSMKVRSIQGAADLVRSNHKKLIRENTELNGFREITDKAFDEYNKLFNKLDIPI